MPSILSTLREVILQPEWTFRFNCYEIGHTWTPHCSDAALEIGLLVFQKSLQMYSGLYLLTHVFFSKSFAKIMDKEAIAGTLASTLRSSSFLGFNAFAMISAFCLLRHATGKFYYSLCATLPAFVGSILAIQIERTSRRSALAFYVANIATECIFKIAVSRGYMRPVPGADVLIFTLSMTVLLHMIKKKGFGHDPVSLVLRLLMGNSEARKVRFAQNQGSDVCPHASDCRSYVVRGFVKPFLAGCAAHSLLAVLSNAVSVLKRPSTFARHLMSSQSIRCGLFLGSFCSIYKGVNCYLRQRDQSIADWHSLPAALIAGPSILWSRNWTVTQHVTWKMIESLYFVGVDDGLVKHPFEILSCIYAASVAVIFYTGVLEPSMLRGSYMKFIDQMTEHRLHRLNRNLLDVFGTGASVGYEDFFPDIVPGLCSHSFMETVFVWVL